MTPEQRNVYMRDYRARKRAEAAGKQLPSEIFTTIPVKVRAAKKNPTPDQIVAEEAARPLFPRTDREYGLPRSNYYSDHAAPGGWTQTIQRIDPHLAQRILDRVAPPRKMR